MEILIKPRLLIAPASYWAASVAEIEAVCNGCGRAGWKGALVPDSIWGLSVVAACQIHDWMYEFGRTQADKDLADSVFLDNLLALIQDRGGWLEWLRSYRAQTYYQAVYEAGDASFWKDDPSHGVGQENAFGPLYGAGAPGCG